MVRASARQVYPARIAPVIAVFILSQLLTVSTMLFFIVTGIVAPMSLFVVMGLSPLLGPIAVAMGMSWLVSPRKRPIGYWLAGCASALLFRFPNTLVYGALAASCFLRCRTIWPQVISVLVMGAVGLAFAAWGGGIWIARLLGLARPALPRVTYAADWAGERVGVRPAAVYELTWPRVRVDAFSFSRYLVVTDAAASLLSDEELFSLCIREVTFFQRRWLAGSLRAFDSVVIFVMLACTIGAAVGGRALLYGTCTGFLSVFLIRPLVRRGTT